MPEYLYLMQKAILLLDPSSYIFYEKFLCCQNAKQTRNIKLTTTFLFIINSFLPDHEELCGCGFLSDRSYFLFLVSECHDLSQKQVSLNNQELFFPLVEAIKMGL